MHQHDVREFMVKAGQTLPNKPTMLSPELRQQRANLIVEEVVNELLVKGIGCRIPMNVDGKYFPVLVQGGGDMVELVDGCLDAIVVITGTLLAAGIVDPRKYQQIVDLNNLAKFGPGGYRREDGKWMKPPNHQPPDLLGELIKDGYDPSETT